MLMETIMKHVSFKLLLVIIAGIHLLFISTYSFSQVDKTQDKEQKEKQKLAALVKKGLDYLAKTQNSNGSWTCRVGYKLNDSYLGEEYDNVGITAIAGIAFLAHGDTPGRGKYGANVEKALRFVLSCFRETDGYITKHGTRMYEHGFAALFLSEVYGMSLREDIKSKLKGSVQLIINSQTPEGGWRYQPSPIDADISVTVTILQALRSARNVGIAVPKEVIDKATSYVKKSQNPTGSFNYQLNVITRVSIPLAAAGVTSLMSAGEYDTPEVRKGIQYILDELRRDPMPYGDYHFFYGHYYAVQAFFQAGGKNWERYFPPVRNEIIQNQQIDGSWIDEVGEAYATAMATLILQIPNDYLPIFQR